MLKRKHDELLLTNDDDICQIKLNHIFYQCILPTIIDSSNINEYISLRQINKNIKNKIDINITKLSIIYSCEKYNSNDYTINTHNSIKLFTQYTDIQKINFNINSNCMCMKIPIYVGEICLNICNKLLQTILSTEWLYFTNKLFDERDTVIEIYLNFPIGVYDLHNQHFCTEIYHDNYITTYISDKYPNIKITVNTYS